eukprot:4578404-Prymnesium_polylepis.2
MSSWRRGYSTPRGRGGRGGYTPRVDGLCLFCDPALKAIEDPPSQPYAHDRKQCPAFRSLKAGLNGRSYCSTHLEDSEARGFAAAGVIFVTRKRGSDPEFLLSRELKKDDRSGLDDKLCFLGGKRLLRSETALNVAVRRARKETGMLLQDGSKLKECALPLVYWEGENKYVYFFIEITADLDIDIDWRCAGIEGAHRLEWVGMTQLLDVSWVREEIHFYAARSVLGLKREGVLQRLMDIFDTAAAAATAPDVPDAPEDTCGSDTLPTILFDFDVVSAILTAARFRDGQTQPPAHVVEALHSLPKGDVRKLQLRFHPDKLGKQLAPREATDEETALSTVAFQLFNNIADRDRKVPEQVKELEAKIAKYKTPPAAKGGTPSADATAGIAELLKKISTSSSKGKGRAM